MTQQLSPQQARYLISQYQGWFGPPILFHHRSIIDGKVRLEALNQLLGCSAFFPTPKIYCHSDGEAIKYLCLAGHYDRARKMCPRELNNARLLSAYCHCEVELVAPLVTKHGGVHCRNVRANNTHRRREAIERIAILLKHAETSDGLVDASELRKALAPWL